MTDYKDDDAVFISFAACTRFTYLDARRLLNDI